MSQAIIIIFINITNFVLISKLEKDHSMIETRRLKNVCAVKKNYKCLQRFSTEI